MKKIIIFFLSGIALLGTINYIIMKHSYSYKQQQTLNELYAKYPDKPKDTYWGNYANGNEMVKAIIACDPKRMEKLDKQGAATNIEDVQHATNFWDVAMQWQRYECFDKLLDIGTRVDVSVLSQAALTEDSYYLTSILKRQKHVIPSDNINHPLNDASQVGYTENVKLLFEHGYPLNEVSSGGTALDWAIKNNNLETAEYLRSVGAKTFNELKK